MKRFLQRVILITLLVIPMVSFTQQYDGKYAGYLPRVQSDYLLDQKKLLPRWVSQYAGKVRLISAGYVPEQFSIGVRVNE